MAKDYLQVTFSTQFHKGNNILQDFTVLITSEASKEVFSNTFEILKEIKIRMSALLILKKMSDLDFKQFKQVWEYEMESSFFYLACLSDDNSYKWFQVITLKGQSKVVLNMLEFQSVNNRNMVILEKYDLDMV